MHLVSRSSSPSARVRRLVRSVLTTAGCAGLGLSLAAGSGCATMVATDTIERFAESLETGDFETLQSLTTPDFAATALPDESSLGTFDLVGLPLGEIEVEAIEELSDTRQRVTATVGEPPQTLVYDLSRADTRSDWRVDEITMRRGNGRAEITRTVTEQMELLLAVRDTIRRWQRDDLTDAIAATEDGLAEPLADLPEAWRRQIADDFFGGVLRGAPKAKLVDGQARIDLSHKTGKLRLLLAGSDDADASTNWTLRTAILTEGRGEKTERDLRTEATVLGATGAFLAAMDASDAAAATEACTPAFAENAIASLDSDPAAFDALDVPFAELAESAYQLRQETTRTEVTIERDETTYQVTVRTARPGDDGDTRPLVEELTTYDGDAIVRLSAQMTLQPVVEVFHDALLAGDVPRLRPLSAKAIDNELWRHWVERPGVSGRSDLFSRVILDPLPRIEPEIVWSGPQMTLTYPSGDGTITYRVRSAESRVLVEDIERTESRSETARSLKLELAALLAMDELADGLLTGDRLLIRQACTPELSSMVWDLQAPEDLPPELDLLPIMRSLPQTIQRTPLDVMVDVHGATIVMRDDAGRLKVDEVIYRGEHGEELHRFANSVRRSRTVQAKANAEMTTR